MKKKASQQNRFLRIISAPVRALCRARDFYVKSMMDCAGSNVIGLHGATQVSVLPRSFSVSSDRSYENDDYRELVRAASARRSTGSRINLDRYIELELKRRAGSGGRPWAEPRRSYSVGMGRIDEDRACCYFGEDGNYKDSARVGMKNESKYPRSKMSTTRLRSAS